MPKITTHYNFSALQPSDTWFPDVDQFNMQIIENLLKAAEYFVQDGIVQMETCAILSQSTVSLKQQFYQAAFDYNNDLFFNVANYDLYYIVNQDVIVDLIAKTNIDLTNIFQQSINGANIIPGQMIFLTSQTISSQNGVYATTLQGAEKLSVQPKKVFVNKNDPVYQYSIWLFNDGAVNKPSINTYDCLLVIDGLIAIQNSKAVTNTVPCYVRPTSSSTTLTIYSPSMYYGTGTPILFLTAYPSDLAVVAATFTASTTLFTNFNTISGLAVTTSSAFLTDFNSQTINQRDSYKILHNHDNAKSKLGLSNLIKLILKPQSNYANACNIYDLNGNIFAFDPLAQIVKIVIANGKIVDSRLITYNTSTRTFTFAFPVASTDEIFCFVTQSNLLVLNPLSLVNNQTEEYTLASSNSADPFTWSETDYDNYNLIINGQSVSQNSYTVDNLLGDVTILQPNPSNLPIDANVFSGSMLELSSSITDNTSFYAKTNKIDTLNASKLFNVRYNQGKHNQFDTQAGIVGYNLYPLTALSPSSFQVPYYNGSSFSAVQPTNDILDAQSSAQFAILNINNYLFTTVDQSLRPLYTNLSDEYQIIQLIKRIQNTTNSFLILFNKTATTEYAIAIADFDASSFTFNQFKFSTTINDIDAVFNGINNDIFLATDTGVYSADFSNLNPVFNKLYYVLNSGGQTLYSYNNHQVLKICISSLTIGAAFNYELYLKINNFPTGSQSIATVNSQTILNTGSSLIVFPVGNTQGISDRGIIYGDNSNCYISTAPTIINSIASFPFTYGVNLTVSSAAVTCYTSSLGFIPSFVNANLSLLDDQNVSVGQYILVRQQNASTQNGIYKITSAGGGVFSATKQTLDNTAYGNYVFITNGAKHANSYWEIDSTSNLATSALVFRLRATNIGAGLGNVNKVFTDLENSIFLSQTGSVAVVYDSTYTTQDIFKHSYFSQNTINQILNAVNATNTIITTKAILSENFTGPGQGTVAFIDYTYPLSQSGVINVDNIALKWVLNQLININYNNQNILASVINATGSNFTLQVFSTNSRSIGQSLLGTQNFTFNNLIEHSQFQQNWWSELYYNNSGSYLTKLNTSQYSGSNINRTITLTDMAITGSLIWARRENNTNLEIDSDNNWNINNNQFVNNYNSIISEFNQTTEKKYIIDHSSSIKELSLGDTIFINTGSNTQSDNISSYVGIIAAPDGNSFIEISSGSVFTQNGLTQNETVYETKLETSQGLEQGIWGNNSLAANTISNDILFNQNLLTAINTYQTFNSSGSVETIILNSADSTSYEDNLTDFSTGISNFIYGANLGISDESVHVLFTISSILYAVCQGKITTVVSPSLIVAHLPFNMCYFTLTNGTYIILGTDNGVYVLDYEFNLLLKTMQNHDVKCGYLINNEQILISVENIITYIDLTSFTSDSLTLPVDDINTINEITTLTETIYLLGTNRGLFALTLNSKSSQQTLINSSGFMGAKLVNLTKDYTVNNVSLNQNNITPLYDDLASMLPADSILDTSGQPVIYDIQIINSAVFLATENGISIYENLFNLNTQLSSYQNQTFTVTSQVLQGFSVNKLLQLTDSLHNINLFLASTLDGVYYTFDNFATLIKANITQTAFSATVYNSNWYIATNQGLFSSTDFGNSYSINIIPRGILLNNTQNVESVITLNNDVTITVIKLPVYAAASGNYNISLTLSSTNYQDGSALTTLATGSFIATLQEGFNIIKFNLSSSVALAKDLTYNIKLTSNSITNLYLAIMNNNNEVFTTSLIKNANKIIAPSPALKLCTTGSNAHVSIDQSLLVNDFLNVSNIQVDGNNKISVLKSGEINLIADTSKSFANQFGGLNNINFFLTDIQSVLGNVLGTFAQFNIIQTDNALTGELNQATIILASLVNLPASSVSRITDAINATLVRANATLNAPSTFSSAQYNAYIAQTQTNNTVGYEFKNILKATNDLSHLSIDYNYNTPLINGTSYDLTQNGFTGSYTGSVYVFLGNNFVPPSDYALTNTFTYTGSLSNNKLSDFELFYSNSGPNLTNLSTLNSQSYFTGSWSQLKATSQSKIILLLTDNIDNASVSAIADYISLNNDINSLIILCGTSTYNGQLFTNQSEKVISLPQNSGESIGNYIDRVGNAITNLTHRALAGSFDIILDTSTVSITVNFNNLNVFGLIKDLVTGELLSNEVFSSGVAVSTDQTDQEKIITIFANGTGSISSIIKTNNYSSEFLFTRPLSTGSIYNGEILFGNVTSGIGNAKMNIFAASGSYSVPQLSPGVSVSPWGAPTWQQQGAMQMTGPTVIYTTDVNEVYSDIVNYRKFSLNSTGSSSFGALPIITTVSLRANGTSQNAWYDWINNYVYSPTSALVSALQANIEFNQLPILNYTYNNFNSLQAGTVPLDTLLTYNHFNKLLQFDSSRSFKIFENLETYSSLNYSSRINMYFSGQTPNKIIKTELIKYPYFNVQKVYKPVLTPIILKNLNVTKYKDSFMSVFGFSEAINAPGRKIKSINSGNWTFSGSIIDTYALYTGSVINLTNLATNTINSAGQSVSGSYNVFSAFDDNYFPDIISVSTLINTFSATTAGLNDTVSLNIIIDRKDGSTGSQYLYKFNIGDQINLSIDWYGCSQVGTAPQIISSGNNITISGDIINSFLNGYIFAKIRAIRGLTVGTTVTSTPIYIT